MYKADGRKIPDVYTEPPDLRNMLQQRLGTFPLFNFWGPASSIKSSQWIADAAVAVHQRHNPTLTLVYLPHLDYSLQKLGPDHPNIPAEVKRIDAVCGKLIDYFQGAGVRIIILSEYGIESVDTPIHVNRILRQAGALRVRQEQGLELLDPGAGAAFAVADHQIAHVYLKHPAELEPYANLCREIPGVQQVLDRNQQEEVGIDHSRAGDLVLVAAPNHWFTYYHWLDDRKAPDFARTVDIHRKPGYDPVELFLDPALSLPKAHIGWKLLKRKLGMRTLLDVIPLDANLVRGSHGRTDQPEQTRPILITQHTNRHDNDELPCTAVHDLILDHLFCSVTPCG